MMISMFFQKPLPINDLYYIIFCIILKLLKNGKPNMLE